MTHIVYLGLGGNLGDRSANLKSAREGLSPTVRLLECSPVYETPPWGYLDQPSFLNQVLKGETEASPRDLLIYLKELERQLGREPTVRFGPRVIDIDILFYDDLVFEMSGLKIPHPRIAGRAFVLLPLADLAPDYLHPVSGKSIREMLEECDTKGISLKSS